MGPFTQTVHRWHKSPPGTFSYHINTPLFDAYPSSADSMAGVRHWPLPVQTLQHLERPVEGTLAKGREDKVREALGTLELLTL